MERNSNEPTVAQVAREFVQRHGNEAPCILRERAELAEAQGDHLAARDWREIAAAAETLL